MAEENEVDVQTQDANEEAEVTAEEEVAESAETEAEESTEEKAETETETEKAPEKVAPRKVFSMPVAKAQEEKRKAVERARKEAREEAEREFAKQREELESKLKANGSETDEVAEVAKKHGLEPEAAKALAEAIRKGIKVPDLSKYDAIVQEREVEIHKLAVRKELADKVEPMIRRDFPNAPDDFIRDVKGKLEDLAFTEGYNTYRIEDLYLVKKGEFNFKNGSGAESPKGHGTDISSFKKLSDEDEIKLADRDPRQYEKYLKWLGGQESRYMD